MEDRPTDPETVTAFAKAQEFRMPFGPYRGSTLDKVAEKDDGLKYLDRIIGLKELHPITRENIKNYLAWPAISAELDQILNARP